MRKKQPHPAGAPRREAPAWTQGRVLHFVRHGQYQGDSETGSLTALGRRQSRRIARCFAGVPIASITSSDAPRAAETAAILAAELGLARPRCRRLLREALPARVPGLRIPLAKRAEGKRRLELILRRYFQPTRGPRQDILVCHGNLIRALVNSVTSGKPDGFHRLILFHAAVTSFVVTQRGSLLLAFNVLHHLPNALRSAG